MPTYPPITVPPDSSPKARSTASAYNRYILAHPTMRRYSQLIYKAALNNGIDPVYYASLLWKESFSEAKRRGVPVETIMAPGGHGYGIAQINPSAHPNITKAQMSNPVFAINWGAQYFAQGLRKYGTYEAAYKQFYNHGYKGPVFNDIPKGYVSTVTAKSPSEKADAKAAQAQADAQQPVLQEMQARQVYDPIYLAYTGKPATHKDIQRLMRNPVSTYQLTNTLSDPKKNPRFYRSPIWQTNYPSYEEIWKNIYGPDSTPDRNAVRYAIVHNLGSSFAQRLRDRPDYNISQEYKGLAAQYGSQYSQIYGTPDATANAKIDNAIRKGWNADQWKGFLRAQPEWQSSGEFQKMAMGLAGSLGFDPNLGAQQTVLSPGQA